MDENHENITAKPKNSRPPGLVRVLVGAFTALAGLVVGVVIGTVSPLHVNTGAPPRPAATATTPQKQRPAPSRKQQIAQAWTYLHGKMPRAGFTGLQPDPYVPGLLHVETRKPNAPVFFNPREHTLIIGLVVNLNNPKMPIAPGIRLPQGLIK